MLNHQCGACACERTGTPPTPGSPYVSALADSTVWSLSGEIADLCDRHQREYEMTVKAARLALKPRVCIAEGCDAMREAGHAYCTRHELVGAPS
jgi:hypothetical protein